MRYVKWCGVVEWVRWPEGCPVRRDLVAALHNFERWPEATPAPIKYIIRARRRPPGYAQHNAAQRKSTTALDVIKYARLYEVRTSARNISDAHGYVLTRRRHCHCHITVAVLLAAIFKYAHSSIMFFLLINAYTCLLPTLIICQCNVINKESRFICLVIKILRIFFRVICTGFFFRFITYSNKLKIDFFSRI